MKRILSLILISFILTGCLDSGSSNKTPSNPIVENGSDNNTPPNSILEGSYVIQTIAADYSSSEVVVGNILGDHGVQQNILATDKSDYTISTYKNYLYHIGRFGIDTISKYDASINLESQVWSYSANSDGGSSANPNKVIHISDERAYVLRINSAELWEINPAATTAADFFVGSIDLSAYNVGKDYPSMYNATYYNGKLFVVLQRINAAWEPEQAYLAVIDTNSNEEIDTGKGIDGLKGIPLNALNPMGSSIHAYNGVLYIAGSGSFTNTRSVSALDKVDLTDYSVTNIADKNSFPSHNLPIISDVVVVDDNNGYIVVSDTQPDQWNYLHEAAKSVIYPFNPSTSTIGSSPVSIPKLDVTGNVISDIALDPNDRLWIAISNPTDPQVLVYYTDNNTQSGAAIELSMPPSKIEFLTTH